VRAYLDHAATSPLRPQARAALLAALDDVGNPASLHGAGRAARRRLETAREDLAAALGASPREVILTSGGTEADNLAVKGIFWARRAADPRRTRVVTSAVEHHAVLDAARWLGARQGATVVEIGVDARGRLDLDALAAELSAHADEVALVSVMWANNEVGTVQPIGEIARMARERGILVHTDAAQSVGKIPVDVGALGVDLLTVAGHKLYAPKGVGALYIREGVRLATFMHGAGHESGRRAGTENVIGIAGLGKACEVAKRDIGAAGDRMKRSRDRLQEGILRDVPDVRVNGPRDRRLPNTLSVAFRGLDAGALLGSMEGLAASAGAACHGTSVEVSKTLRAMGVPLEWSRGTIRLSTGKCTTDEEVDRAIDIIAGAVKKLR